jgi:hypothetical protein
MTAAVAYNPSSRPARTKPSFETSPFPSEAALRLEQTPMWELEKIFVRGATPDLDSLVGWEFRGINHPAWAKLAGIKKFVKGFFRTDDGRVKGYNSPVEQNVLDGRWHIAPKRFGFYLVAPVDATARDNAYLHSVLLDYGKGGNPVWDASRGLRDYLVQVAPGDPDLLIGKAYAAVGPARLAVGYFILERWRRAPGSAGR